MGKHIVFWSLFPMTQQARSHPIRNRLDGDRLTEILDIAAEVFVAEGFSAASTNEIARRANSSKTTFYSRFPTKEHLFIAVIERRMTGMFDLISSALPQEPPLAETLREFGGRLLRNALSKEQVALVRVISMESAKFPRLGERFFELGPKRGQAALAEYFAGQVARGRLRDADTPLMAEHYVSLVTGGPVRWIALGFQPKPMRPGEVRRHVEAATEVFLRAYAVGGR
jgi:TetR/AcrR family transcriptional repressor of mexJK operon